MPTHNDPTIRRCIAFAISAFAAVATSIGVVAIAAWLPGAPMWFRLSLAIGGQWLPALYVWAIWPTRQANLEAKTE